MSEFCLVQIMAPNEEWFRVLPNANQLATDVIQRAVRESRKVNASSEVSVVFSDDRELQLLNKEYRGVDKPTNVLSFPGPEIEPEDPNSYTVRDRPHVLGDIVLSLETTQREAQEQGKELKHHVAHLLVHGALHLLRYDHENDGDAQVMEDLERAVLAGLGIGDPYLVDEADSAAEPAPAAAESPAASADAQLAPRAKPRRKAAAKRSPKKAIAKPAVPRAKRGAANKASGKKAAGKRLGAKRAPARSKTSATRRTAVAKRKAASRQPVRAAKRPVSKRAAPPKRSAAKRAAPKRTAPMRASSKRAPSKRVPSKRAAPKRAAPKRAGKRTARAKKR
jgi:probable rRNA maturation factor